jgi:hypothetical protein
MKILPKFGVLLVGKRNEQAGPRVNEQAGPRVKLTFFVK